MGEFVARLGLIALNNSVITGSLTVTNGITGSLFGTSSWASQAISASQSQNATTASYVLNAVSSSFAATASNILGGATNYLPLFNTATSLSSSVLYQSSGQIGIGTTTPKSILHVGNLTGSEFSIGKTNYGGSSDQALASLQSDQDPGGAGGYLIFKTLEWGASPYNLVERARIDYDGRLGIGTTSPQQKLVVSNAGAEGLEIIPAPSANANQIQSYNRSTSAYNSLILRASEYNVQIGTTATLYISASGNVGIGTTTPESKLDVNGNTFSRGVIFGYVPSTTTQYGGLSYGLVGSTDGYMFLKTGGNTTVQLQASGSTYFNGGNVGIGTTSPNAKLDVNGNAIVTGSLTVTGTITAQTLVVQTVTSSVSFITGSTKFGSLLANTHEFTGSVGMTGSLSVMGGNVGIGTTSPAAKLTVQGTTSDQIRVYEVTDSTNYYRIGRNSTTGYLDFYGNQSGYTGYVFNGVDGERMRIDSSGRVGIGTTSPGYALQVDGAATAGFVTSIVAKNPSTNAASATKIGFDNGGTIWGEIGASYNSNSPYMAFFVRANSEKMRITDGGSVGIGTTTPLYRLHVRTSAVNDVAILDTTAGGGSNLLFSDGNTVTAPKIGALGDQLTFTTNNTVQARINTSGNFLLGTTNNNARLTVLASGSSSDVAYLSTATAGAYIVLADGNTTASPRIGAITNNIVFNTTSSGTPVERMRIDSTGNVGIGTTSPASTLDVRGVVEAGTGTIRTVLSYTGTGGVVGTLSNHPLIFYANNDERARITAAGNVGIGTTSPTASLHVYRRTTGTTTADRTTPLDVLVLESENTADQEYEGFGQSLVFRGSTYNDSTQRTLGKIIHQINDNSVNTTRGTSLNIQLSTGSVGNTLASRLYIDYNGNVGVGTTSPYNYSTWNFATLNGNGGSGIVFRNNNVDTTQLYGFSGGTDLLSTGYFQLYTGGSVRMYVGTTGNIGIGTTSPSYTLDVSGSIRSTSNAYFATSAGSVGIGTTNPLGAFGINSGTGVVGFNVGSISSPTRGNLFYDTDGTGWKFSIGKYQSSTYTAQMTFQDNGNIGIGTTSPSTKLHISSSGTVGLNVSVASSDVAYFQRTDTGNALIQYTSFDTTSDIIHRFRLNNGAGNFFDLRYYAASNYLGFDYGGTTRLAISSSGNIGIGTTSPSARLHVSGSTTTNLLVGTSDLFVSASGNVGIGTTSPTANLQIGSTSTSGNRTLVLTDANYGLALAGGNGPSSNYIQSLGTSIPLYFLAGNSNNANYIFSSTGKMGIGSTSPGAKVHIRQAGSEIPLIIDSSAAVSGAFTQYQVNSSTGWEVGMAGSGDSYKWFFTYGAFSAANSKIAITSDGNMGIGTTSPSAPLMFGKSVYGAPSSEDFYRIKFEDVGGINNDVGIGQPAAGAIGFNFVPSTGYIMFNEGTSNERMRIAAGGNVGIGLTSPSARLHVSASTGGVLEVDGSGTAGNNALYVSASGNVGIGTSTPAYKLHVVGGDVKLPNNYKLYFGDVAEALGFSIGSDGASNNMLITNNNNATLRIGTGGTSGHMTFTPNSVESVRFTGTGDVGINTTSPAAKLQVNGNTLITGSLTVGQTVTGSSENTLTIGVPPAGGTGEGGQILLAASGGLYTSASMLDTYQNKFRVLRGTNASSDAYKLQLDMHTGQMQLPNYNSSTAFTGTAVADLAVDSSGNIITIATGGGGGGGSVTINNNVDNYLITATGTANTLNGEANLQFNGSALTVTGSLTVVTGSAIELQVTNTGVNIGNAFTDVHRITGSLNMPHTASGVIKIQDASVWADAANYKNPQIRLPDYQTGITLINNDEIQFVTNATAPMGLKLSAGIPKVTLDSSAWLQWSSAETNGFTHDIILKRESVGVLAITGSIKSSGGFTGSLQGTSSWAVSASWAPSAGGSAPTAVTFNRVTGSYTFVLTDAGKTVEVSGSTATSHSLTIPASSSVDFADGTYIDVVLYGTGSILFVTGSGVTVRSANNWLRIGTRYGAATLINISGNEWYLIGNLNA